MKRKILFIDDIHPFLIKKLKKNGFKCEVDLTSSREEFLNKIGGYFGLICRSRFTIDKQILKQAKQLKFIARAGVGIEHIDTKFAQKKGIKVFKSPEGSADAVGEQAVGMLLNLMQNITKSNLEIKNGKWLRKSNSAIELKGKTVGILGYGNMGKSFARKLSGFGAKVITYDKYKTNYGDQYAKQVSLKKIQKEADILSIHIFYEIDNHYFINRKFINKFEKNIWIINTARGLVLKTSDLVKALKKGKIKGAALDVLEYEETSFNDFSFQKLPKDFEYLVNAQNVILTPHLAGLSEESYEGHARVLARKILRWDGVI